MYKKHSLLLTLVAAVCSAPLAAQTASLSANEAPIGAYAGFGLGGAKFALKKEDFRLGGENQRAFKESSASFKVFAGYRVSEFAAVEAQIASLGESKIKYATGALSLGEEKFRSQAVSVAAVGFVPLGRDAALFAKLGPSLMFTESKWSSASLGPSQKDRKVGVIAGLGATYNVARNAFVRLEAEHYSKLGTERKAGRANALVGSLSVGYRF